MAKTSHQSPKNDPRVKKRVLISVSVLGSTGPIRMLVNENDPVARVIHNALKQYAREGRIPVIGSDPDRHILYCHDGVGSCHVMGASNAIGSTGERSFLMAPKEQPSTTTGAHVPAESRARPASCFKSWLSGSLSVKITRWVN